MKKLLLLFSLFFSLSALAQESKIDANFPPKGSNTVRESKANLGFKDVYSHTTPDYDSLVIYAPGRSVRYNGHRWAATDTVGVSNFPAEDNPNWSCEDCFLDGGTDPDLSPFARKDGFAELMKLNVEDYDIDWFLRPDGSSPSGYYLQGRIDSTRWATNWRVDSLLASFSGGSGGHIIAYQDDSLAQQPVLKFKGAGVSVADSIGKTIVTISGYPSPPIGGAVIYVSPDGSDANGERGNISSPFFSLSGAKTAYQAGDVIHVFPGVYTGQSSLTNSGNNMVYYFSPGADVTFASNIVLSSGGSIVVRGEGKLSGTGFSFSSAGEQIDIEADAITVSGNFFVLAANYHRLKAREVNLGSSGYWAIQHTTKAIVEVGTFTMLNTADAIFHQDNTLLEFSNTRFDLSCGLNFYQASTPYVVYSVNNFRNCEINCTQIFTRSGPGTTNSFYGRVALYNSTVNATLDGILFVKIEPGTEFWFDGAQINSGVGYHSMNATASGVGTQGLPPEIRIFGGGLVLDKDVTFDVARPITNLVPGTYAVRQDYTGTSATSRFSGIIVTDEPGAGGSGGGSGGDADSLGGVPASGYIPYTGTGSSTISGDFRVYNGFSMGPNDVGGSIWPSIIMDTLQVSLQIKGSGPGDFFTLEPDLFQTSAMIRGNAYFPPSNDWDFTQKFYVDSLFTAAGGTTTNDLSAGTGVEFITGTTFNGSAARTLRIDATVATLTGTQTLTNKTLTSPVINSGSLGSSTVANTQTANDNSTKVSTTAYTDAAVSAGIVSVRETITQTAHGFSAYTILRHNGTDWVAASSSNVANSRALGIIESVTTNTFVIVYAGKITLSGLTAGTEYFLSSTGTLTTTEPNVTGTVIKSILSTTSTTSGIVQIQNPGQEN